MLSIFFFAGCSADSTAHLKDCLSLFLTFEKIRNFLMLSGRDIMLLSDIGVDSSKIIKRMKGKVNNLIFIRKYTQTLKLSSIKRFTLKIVLSAEISMLRQVD